MTGTSEKRNCQSTPLSLPVTTIMYASPKIIILTDVNIATAKIRHCRPWESWQTSNYQLFHIHITQLLCLSLFVFNYILTILNHNFCM